MSSKISALGAGTPAQTTDQIPINRGGTNYSLTVSDIIVLAGGLFTPGGRLTLTSGTPVTTSDVTAAGTLYYTPHVHDYIMLYNGSAWQAIQFTEKSLALTLASGSMYDIFGYISAGALALESLVWTNITTRATALAYQNGRLVKSGAATRLYLGTIYASGVNQTQDAVAGRYVVNAYNQVTTSAYLNETSDISTTSDVYADATAALTILTLGGESPAILGTLSKGTTATQDHYTGLLFDATSTNIGASSSGATRDITTPSVPPLPTAGGHTVKLQWKRVSASGTCTCRPTSETNNNWRKIMVTGLVR